MIFHKNDAIKHYPTVIIIITCIGPQNNKLIDS